MQFASPTLLASLALVPVYVWLRLRQRRPPVAVVSSLLLWKAVPPAPQAALARRERLWNLVLLIEGLSLALVCAAAARPYVMRETTRPVHLVLAIDDSASMGTRDRWERLLKRAVDLLGGLEDGDAVTLLTSRMEVPRASPGKVRFGFLGVTPTTTEDDLDGLLARARALAGAEEGAVVRLLTDRVVPDAPEVESFGGPVDNAGIVDACVQGNEVFALVAATSPRRVTLELTGPRSGSRTVIADATVEVQAAPAPVLVPFQGTPPEFVRLTTRDDLAADDEVRLGRDAVRIPVRIDTPGNPELVRAISVQPGVDVVLGDSGRAEVTVLDRVWPKREPIGRLVVIAPPAECPYRGEEVTGPIETWDTSHPLLEGLDPQAVAPTKAYALDEGFGRVRTLATIAGKVVIAEIDEGGSFSARHIYIGFDVSLAGGVSTWATHPHFPVFWNRLLRYLPSTRPRDAEGRAREGLLSRRETLCSSQATPSHPVDFARTRVVSSPRFFAAPALAAAAMGFSLAFLLSRRANGWRSSSSSTTR